MTTGESAHATEPAEAEQEKFVRFLKRPPGLWFHLSLVVPTLVALWSATVPGGTKEGPIAAVVLLFLVLLWISRAVIFLFMSDRWSWWLAVAPIGLVVVLALLFNDVPLKARWLPAQNSFATTLDGLTEPTPQELDAAEDGFVTLSDTPQRIAGYDVASITAHGDVTSFDLDVDDRGPLESIVAAAFLYSEVGDAGLYERGWSGATPLGDGWYAFTAYF